jgi:hypothetical protein
MMTQMVIPHQDGGLMMTLIRSRSSRSGSVDFRSYRCCSSDEGKDASSSSSSSRLQLRRGQLLQLLLPLMVQLPQRVQLRQRVT